MQIRNNIYHFQTIRGRRLLEYIVPQFVRKALAGDNPDAALLQLVGFSGLLAASESYLEPLVQRPRWSMPSPSYSRTATTSRRFS